MGQQKPWEKDWSAPQQGPIVLGTPSAKSQYEGPTAAADLAAKQQEARLRELQIQAAQLKLQAGGGELPPPPGDPNKTGEEYLATLPRGMAPTVRSMLEGRMAPPSSFAQSKPYWQQMMSAANQADPSFDQTQWASRTTLRKAYESQAKGSPSQVIQSLNTLAAHANSMYGHHLKMAGPNLGPLSGTAAGIMQSFDQKDTPAYNTEVGFVQGELQKLVNNGQSSVTEAERIIHNLRAAQSFEARGEAIKAVADLAKGKLDPLHQGWSAVFGDKPMPSDITPSSMAVFDNILNGGAAALPTDRRGTPIAPSDSAVGTVGGGGPPTVGPTGGGAPPPPGNRGGPSADKTPQFYDPNGGGPGGQSLSQGQYHDVYDPQVSAQIDGMIRKGYSPDRINTALANTGRPPVDPAQVTAAQAYLKLHPDYNGGFANATNSVPTKSAWLNDFQQSAPGVFLDQLSNAGTFGNKANLIGLAGGNADLQRGGMEQAAVQHPYAAIGGNIVGGTAGAMGMETGIGALGRAAGLGAKAAPWLARGADAAYGGITGASENPDDPWAGVKGALAGVGGGMFGSKIVAPVIGTAARKIATSRIGQAVGNTVRDFRDLPPMSPPPQPLGGADKTLLSTAERAGIPGIQAQLSDAANLGVPMALADTHPELTSLTGAVVRRSPNADALAQSAFIPRSRGQIDRFGQAVERDLGPVANVPQLSEDLARQAKTAAAPLYERAYAASGVNSPEIDSLLATPFGKEGLARAHTIAANNRVDPLTLGIDLSPHGEPVLTRVPSMQTLDYAKQGMDDVLEQYRNSFGKLQLTPAGNAQNAVKNSLLSEIDRLNPAYREARAAYAGPMQSRDALALGQDAIGMNPDTLGVGLAGKSPEQLGQVQLGFRSGLMDQGNKVRYSTNPFDATLGTPAAEQRLSTVYPNHPGVPNLLRQRDMENGLARTTNDILGNSKTAQRAVADNAFAGDGLLQTGLDLGINAATGQVPIGTVIKGVGKLGLRDMMKLGVGKRAIAKADALAPLLLNTNPAASSDSLSALLDSSKSYRDFVDSYNRRFGRPSGMFGAALGTGLTTR